MKKLPEGNLKKEDISDLCYSFQITVGNILKDRCHNAISRFLGNYSHNEKNPALVVCGGVAANQHIRTILQDLTSANRIDFIAPPLPLCSDNGAMIAWVGIEKLKRQMTDTLNIAAKPRWPLDPTAEKKTRWRC